MHLPSFDYRLRSRHPVGRRYDRPRFPRFSSVSVAAPNSRTRHDPVETTSVRSEDRAIRVHRTATIVSPRSRYRSSSYPRSPLIAIAPVIFYEITTSPAKIPRTEVSGGVGARASTTNVGGPWNRIYREPRSFGNDRSCCQKASFPSQVPRQQRPRSRFTGFPLIFPRPRGTTTLRVGVLQRHGSVIGPVDHGPSKLFDFALPAASCRASKFPHQRQVCRRVRRNASFAFKSSWSVVPGETRFSTATMPTYETIGAGKRFFAVPWSPPRRLDIFLHVTADLSFLTYLRPCQLESKRMLDRVRVLATNRCPLVARVIAYARRVSRVTRKNQPRR